MSDKDNTKWNSTWYQNRT